MDKLIRSKLEKIYYSPRGYWKGQGAIKKLAQEAKVLESKTREWLAKQAIWQIYLSYPKYIPRPTSANALQQKPNFSMLFAIQFKSPFVLLMACMMR